MTDIITENLEEVTADGSDDDFVENDTPVCFVKLITGQEILAEVTVTVESVKNKKTRSIILDFPLVIYQLPSDETGNTKIATIPFINSMLSDEDTVAIKEEHILFIVENVSPVMVDLYYKNAAYIQSMREKADEFAEGEDGPMDAADAELSFLEGSPPLDKETDSKKPVKKEAETFTRGGRKPTLH